MKNRFFIHLKDDGSSSTWWGTVWEILVWSQRNQCFACLSRFEWKLTSWFCVTLKMMVFIFWKLNFRFSLIRGFFTRIEVTRGAYASISFIFLATFVSSTFLNCMLLAVIGKYDGLKNPLRMLLLNMASCDLIATILGVFMTTISKRDLKSQKPIYFILINKIIITISCLNAMGYFYLGMTACKIEGFITFFCGSTRLLR